MSTDKSHEEWLPGDFEQQLGRTDRRMLVVGMAHIGKSEALRQALALAEKANVELKIESAFTPPQKFDAEALAFSSEHRGKHRGRKGGAFGRPSR